MGYDFSQFNAYRRLNTRRNGRLVENDDYVLRFWKDAKNLYLKKLFGDELILERSFSYRRSKGEMFNLINDMMDQNERFCQHFCDNLKKALDIPSYGWYNRYDDDDPKGYFFHYVRQILRDSNFLLENRITGVRDNLCNGKKGQYCQVLKDGTKINIADGMKTTRFFGNLCNALGLSEEITSENKITGTMCLSIHPLDYATASDNENGWSSCMSWAEEGCYRMGTVEMMNSPMVICAYLKSDEAQMEIDHQNWNSKKWRAWIITTPEIILCNKQYPIHNVELGTFAVNWVKELVEKAYGWTYTETEEEVLRKSIRDRIEFSFRTVYMYDDIDRNAEMMIGCYDSTLSNSLEVSTIVGAETLKYGEFVKHRDLPHYDEETCEQDGMVTRISINYSGYAECMVCGARIYSDEVDSDRLECGDCYAEYVCCECGEHIENEDDVYEYNGSVYCRSCYEELFATCDYCGEVVLKDEATMPEFSVDEHFMKKWQNKIEKLPMEIRRSYIRGYGLWGFTLNNIKRNHEYYCPHCLERKGIYLDSYGYIDPFKTSLKDFISAFDIRGGEFITEYSRGYSHPVLLGYGPETTQIAEKFFKEFIPAMWEYYKEHYTKDRF